MSENITKTEVLKRIGMTQNSAQELGANLARYVYAYFDPQDWADRIDAHEDVESFDESLDNAPAPFYVGIGVGDRFAAHIDEARNGMEGAKREKIRELIADGSAPDIRFLAYGLPTDDEESVSGRTAVRTIETVLLNLYGVEYRGSEATSRESFDDRMGYPRSLTNRAGSSIEVPSGSLPVVSGEMRGLNELEINSVESIVEEIQEEWGIENVLFIGISGSYSPRANIDQLRSITCEWWNLRDTPLQNEKFVVLGWSRDNHREWQDNNGNWSRSIPVIRAVFVVDAGEVEESLHGDRVSFTHRANFDSDLWSSYVGTALDRTTNQMQGKKWGVPKTESKADLSSIRFCDADVEEE